MQRSHKYTDICPQTTFDGLEKRSQVNGDENNQDAEDNLDKRFTILSESSGRTAE